LPSFKTPHCALLPSFPLFPPCLLDDITHPPIHRAGKGALGATLTKPHASPPSRLDHVKDNASRPPHQLKGHEARLQEGEEERGRGREGRGDIFDYRVCCCFRSDGDVVSHNLRGREGGRDGGGWGESRDEIQAIDVVLLLVVVVAMRRAAISSAPAACGAIST